MYGYTYFVGDEGVSLWRGIPFLHGDRGYHEGGG
jgi:hypothetical protein